MKQVKRAFAMLLCIATILSLCMVYAVADNVCSEITGTGDPSSSVTFMVTTNSKWGKNNLKITQTKGNAQMWSGDEYKTYGRYTVTYINSNGKEKNKSFTGESVTLDLKPSQTYSVIVTAYSNTDLGRTIQRIIPRTGGVEDVFLNWKEAPTWKVSAQKNVTLCQG